MKANFYFLFLLLLLVSTSTGLSQAISRQVIGSAGEDASLSNSSVSWTIGEPVIETFSSGEYSLLQGFHGGGYVISELGIIEQESLGVNMYPNPAEDHLIIDFEEPQKESYIFRLVSTNGTQIIRKELPSRTKRETIDLSGLKSGSYIVEIFNSAKKKTFTLIKK